MPKNLLVFFIMMLIANLSFADSIYTKPDAAAIKAKLTPEQYQITQEKGTEQAYNNAYWDNKKPGIYVDIVTGEPLFSSLDKYNSKTGWPSFTKPLEPDNIITQADKSQPVQRTEVLSKVGQSHLGHVFNDGPPPTHQRWCMNSAALEFIPIQDLKKRGYEKYIPSFDEAYKINSTPTEDQP